MDNSNQALQANTGPCFVSEERAVIRHFLPRHPPSPITPLFLPTWAPRRGYRAVMMQSPFTLKSGRPCGSSGGSRWPPRMGASDRARADNGGGHEGTVQLVSYVTIERPLQTCSVYRFSTSNSPLCIANSPSGKALQKGVNLKRKPCINTKHMPQEVAWKRLGKRETEAQRSGAEGSALLPGIPWVSNWLPWAPGRGHESPAALSEEPGGWLVAGRVWTPLSSVIPRRGQRWGRPLHLSDMSRGSSVPRY